VRVIVGFPPGGSLDVMTRVVAERVQGRLGQPFVVETRSGASGNVGAEALARAAPDGYKLALELRQELGFCVTQEDLAVPSEPRTWRNVSQNHAKMPMELVALEAPANSLRAVIRITPSVDAALRRGDRLSFGLFGHTQTWRIVPDYELQVPNFGQSAELLRRTC
jgi:tripartite-type tricarboxylate transporter receptor subunit TctC